MAVIHARITDVIAVWAKEVSAEVSTWPTNDLNAVSLQSRHRWLAELADIVLRLKGLTERSRYVVLES